LQIVYGLLCDLEGCPVAVEVFPLSLQIEKIRKRFSLKRVILVSDRALLTEVRLRE
jgi:hypothetical protein